MWLFVHCIKQSHHSNAICGIITATRAAAKLVPEMEESVSGLGQLILRRVHLQIDRERRAFGDGVLAVHPASVCWWQSLNVQENTNQRTLKVSKAASSDGEVEECYEMFRWLHSSFIVTVATWQHETVRSVERRPAPV